MAVPKRKTSKAKSRSRKANWKLTLASLVECPKCREMKVSHKACKVCGFYKENVSADSAV